jgi:hypothetical protein
LGWGGEWHFFIEFDLCGDGHKLKTKLEINLAFQRLIFRMVAAKIILSLIVFFSSFLSFQFHFDWAKLVP